MSPRLAQNFHKELTISLQLTNETQVQCAVKSLKSNKATGHDFIPAKTLTLGARELAASLTKLYNSCISIGKWPCEWKKGVWSPIFKKDDPLDRENYRPITVHSAMDKVLEQLVSEQITTKFDNYLEQCITA